uniref:Caprin-1_dimer domain-containing protein n=1 Tax=Wuchereria bancrofti TaxID=6293 RepID=A0AAF5PS90_WUCBA
MEKQFQQLLIDDASRSKSMINQNWFKQKPKFGNAFQETRMLINERINELETRYEELSKKRNNLDDKNKTEDKCIEMNFEMDEVKNQLMIMYHLNKVHMSDMKKIQRKMDKERKKNKKRFIKRMEDFQHYKGLLQLMQNCEVREAFRTKTSGAIRLTEEELDYLHWLNEEINPSINLVENNKIWRKKIRESALKAMEITFGSNKTINDCWTGNNTKRLLERISKCDFFKGRTMWVNMAMFNRINTSAFAILGSYPYPYYNYYNYYNYDNEQSNPEMESNIKNAKDNDQKLNNNSASNSTAQQKNTEAKKKTNENYKFIKGSSKPDVYYLCFNYYPARFTADVNVPSELAGRPPPGIFRCDI